MSSEKLAMVFPGQGSQFVGMVADLASQYPQVEEYFLKASELLAIDLWSLVQHGPDDALNQTEHTQPALLVASYVMWLIMQQNDHGMQPDMMAGHSLGEYTALLCAGSISFEAAVKLVFARGQFMQQAVQSTQGAMAAIIGLSDADVLAVCQQSAAPGEVLSPANYNSPGQIVIAGHQSAVENAVVKAKEEGAKMAMLIPVSVPSHCELMKPAAQELAEWLKTIAIDKPTIPVISNVDIKPYADAEGIRDGLVRQLYSPVRWIETVEYFAANGITNIIECGPGKVLTGLNKRINKSLTLKTTQQAMNF